MHTYHPNVQQRIWSNFNFEKFVKSEICRLVSQRLGLKGVKIDQNIMKFGNTLVYKMGIQIHDQISIARKLSKVKLRRAFSLEFDLKRVQIARNIEKFDVHACISNGHPNLCSNFNSKNLVKSETPSFDFAKVWLKGGENRSEHHKNFHALLSN